jgi:hypothetical protein
MRRESSGFFRNFSKDTIGLVEECEPENKLRLQCGHMLAPLILGCLMVMGNMLIQIVAVVVLVQMLLRKINSGGFHHAYLVDVRIVSTVLMVLFAGHLLQFATWALLFVGLGEFTNFHTAFYFSAVNFTSLGYGDIVMSERWRLLGALEAANGVMMFGLSASTILSVMNRLFGRRLKGKIDPEMDIRTK